VNKEKTRPRTALLFENNSKAFTKLVVNLSMNMLNTFPMLIALATGEAIVVHSKENLPTNVFYKVVQTNIDAPTTTKLWIA